MTFEHTISIDAECNGLAGQAFAVAMTLSDSFNGEVGHVVFRCPIAGDVNEWVAGNVLPAIEDVEVNCLNYNELLHNLRHTWDEWTDAHAETLSYLIGHVVWPVEARLLLDMFPGEEVWSGPYPLIDVASVLLAKGHNPLSVDDYLKAQGIPVPSGSPHNPLYDARAAECCLRHLMGGAQ